MAFTNAELSKLPSVGLLDKDILPNCAAIYFVTNSSGQILYIGRTVNLVERWKEHHRFNQLRKLNRKDPIRISWLTCPREMKTLIRLEEEYIAHYKPALNRTKVVTSVRKITLPETALQQSLQQLVKVNTMIFGYDPTVDDELATLYLIYPVWRGRGASGTIRSALRSINKKASGLKWKEYRRLPKSMGKFGCWETEYSGIRIDLTPVQGLVGFMNSAARQTVAGVEMMAFRREQLILFLRDVPEDSALDVLTEDPFPVELRVKQPPNEGKDKRTISVEPWEELEPMPEGKPRVMTRQFLHPEGVEVEICHSDNGKHFVRHNAYWWIVHRNKNPDPERQAVVKNLEQVVDALPTIRWSGYRYRLETIVFSEDDVEVESILLPLAMFEDLMRDAMTKGFGRSLAEEIRSGNYRAKPEDSGCVKLCAWLQRNSLQSLLETND